MKLLQTYFQHKLASAGFPDNLVIEYSLSYCQGDGMAFYGTLYRDDLVRLFNHLNPNKRRQNMFAKLLGHLVEWGDFSHIQISRNHFGHRYSHWNCMVLEAEEAQYLAFFYAGKADWYFPTAKLGQYMAIWDDFLSDLRQHIQDTSKELASLGYQIIDATPCDKQKLYQFSTEHYSVQLIAEHCDFYNQPAKWFTDEMSDFEEILDNVINGKVHYANLYAQVLDRQTGQSLGEDYIDSACFDPTDKGFSGYKAELIQNAIAAARRNTQKYAALHA